MPRTSHTKAFIYMTIAMLCFSLMSTAIHAVEGMAVTQMVFIRNAMALVILTIWVKGVHGNFRLLKTDKLKQHFWRNLIGVIGMHFWFASLIMLPLNMAMALSFTVPIFGTILAVVFLGERTGIRRVCAIIVGFIGVLIVIRPDTQPLDIGIGVGLAAALAIATTSTMIKSLTRTESTEAIIYYMAVFMTLLSAPMGIYEWQAVSAEHWWLLLLIAILSTAAHQFMTRAFTMADLVTLMPIDYTRLIFTAILAYIFFDEVITSNTILGAVIIMASTFYIVRREAQKRKAHKPVSSSD